MIYEFRTYTLKPRSLAEVEKRYGEAYEYRKKYSPLTAFWHTEIGPLNEIIHVWGYKDLAERARIRAEASKDANWPPKIRDFVVDQDVEILTPLSFVPDITPGTLGPIFEIRRYSLMAGSLPGVAKRWEGKIDERTKFSPLALAGHVEHGQANSYLHIWPYESLNHRAEIREKARAAGAWPPPGGGDMLLTQENKIMLPAAFSPVQ